MVPNYCCPRTRLRSFEGWPLTNIAHSPEIMSRCGFFYTGCADKVICFSCGVLLRHWRHGDCPLLRHLDADSKCSFASQIDIASLNKDLDELRTILDSDDYNYTEVFEQKPVDIQCITEGRSCQLEECVDDTRISENLTVTGVCEQTATSTECHRYSKLENRLDSFTGWPMRSVAHSPEFMSKSGFYYTGSADRVTCFCCGICLRNWKGDDYPPCRHVEDSPNCPFAKSLNVEAILNNMTELQRLMVEYDDYNCTEQFEYIPPLIDELLIGGLCCEETCSANDNQNDSSPQELDLQSVLYHGFSDRQRRVDSFSSWPLTDVAHSPEMMARSGFFYTGSADKVTCFSCGVTLRDWGEGDIPACIHRLKSGECSFVEQLNLDHLMRDLEELEMLLMFDDYNFTEVFARRSVSSSTADTGVRFGQSKFVGTCTENC